MDGHPEIEYPCEWSYRVIGEDEAALRVAVASVMGDVAYDVLSGNMSRTGRYCSVEVRLVVADDAARVDVFRRLAAHADVRMVL